MVAAVVAYTGRDLIHSRFVSSLIALYTSPFGRDNFGDHLITLETGPNIALARTWVTTRFLESDRDWVLMVDTDMTFTPTDVENLFAAADTHERPIVTGLYCNTDGNLEVGYRDTSGLHELTTWVSDPEQLLGDSHLIDEDPADWTPRPRIVEVDACGAGMLLVHRRVFAAFDDWFAPPSGQDESEGEDMAFCRRAKAAGFPISAALDVAVGHLKTRELTVTNLPEIQRDLIAASFGGGVA